MPEFSKLLVANRGEIACRILRSARAMGYETVAIYSEADENAPHVRLADEAFRLGQGPVAESYLNIERVLLAAQQSHAGAVHPGYGFLSENAAFADACEHAGLTFVGPPAEAMRMMADKARAKTCMQEAGIPIVPGFWARADDRQLVDEAGRIGFPLLVKATAGGGGRGIRVVADASALTAALSAARAEAASAFGDGRVMLERYVERARHVEVQILSDSHGNTIHLGERDCSAQRRRQKIIEEAPCPTISTELRHALGNAAVNAARAVGYRGAGTIEFIVDPAGCYYFLEMNTRLQVEHPVTELITGLDLVALQLSVATGEPLPLTQSQVCFQGHAIEARLYAEDPAQSFAPQTGRVLGFDPQRATKRQGVRIDSGVEAGTPVTPYYDGMLAKVIAHGRTRAEATRRLARALADAPLFGPRTNAGFLRALLQSEAFVRAEVHTALIDGWLAQAHALLRPPEPPDELWALAACMLGDGDSAGWLRPRGVDAVTLVLTCDAWTRKATVARRDRTIEVTVDEVTLELRLLDREEGSVRYQVGALTKRLPCLRTRDALHLSLDGAIFVFREPSVLGSEDAEPDPHRVVAPLAGVVGRVPVATGDQVRKGDVLVVIEAMKMEVRVPCNVDARIETIHHQVGAQVDANALLIELGPLPENG